MPEFDTAHVKNIVLLGHAGSGKTTLAECMLFETGSIRRQGNIIEQNTTADYHPLEKERGNSIFSKLLHVRWRGFKINILDTPGYEDFAGEVIAALRVADTGIMLLNAENGVEPGTDTIWDYTQRFKTPMVFAVSKLDSDQADYDRTVEDAHAHFGPRVTVVQYPLQTGAGFHEIVDVLRMTLYKFRDTGGKPEKLPIPEEERPRAEQLHKALVEAVAGNDEKLMEIYFEKGELDEEELRLGMKQALINQELFPLFCLSAERNMGSGRLMGFIDHVCPSANEMPAQLTRSGQEIPIDPAAPPCLFVFKTVAEPHIGELSFFKVFAGTVRSGMELENETTGGNERLSQLFLIEGNERMAVPELTAGDIGATLKLKNTHVNNTLHAKGRRDELPSILFPQSVMTVAVEAAKKGEEEKLAQALHHLREEDPSLQVEVSAELRQTLLHLQGDMHLAVIRWKMENIFHLDVKFDRPRVPYRETIRRAADATYRHKKQSGGAGQFGEVTLRIEPWYDGMPDPEGLNVRNREDINLDWGGKLVFCNCVVGGAIDTRFMPSILKGVMEKMQHGPLTGSYARDIRVCVMDGKMHPVDSNDVSFKLAGLQAFRQAFREADPQLLEPVCQVQITCPEEWTGAVMGDLQTRRGIVLNMGYDGSLRRITAQIPQAEMEGYSSALRSLTQGRARFNRRYLAHEAVPFELQRKLTDEYQSQFKEEVTA